jgi:diaminohydroxyphosphoribosylaminopyrimidine deaminase/5-amino-6-(5-phosphoribosylamino)uracil reductase
MTLDGKIATHTGHSKWISSPASRAIVHQLRGRVDGILVGRGTVEADDPLLVARPSGARVATRIVADSHASLDQDSQLVKTAREVPVLVALAECAPEENRQRLMSAGCELLNCSGDIPAERLGHLLDQLGQRRMTNVLVEGGSRLLGSLWDAHQIDEIHVFVAPKIAGGQAALSSVGGSGLARIPDELNLADVVVERVGDDVYIYGRVIQTSNNYVDHFRKEHQL